MEKEPYTKFCGVLIGSQEVPNPSYVMPYPRMYETFRSWFSFHMCINFMKKDSYTVHSGYM